MPNKISLSDVQTRLPEFVKIIPESYRGVRYKADFIDTEYNERFSACVNSVIELQHGCSSRSNDMRSKTNTKKFKGKRAGENKTPIEDIVSQLPPFLEIQPETYEGSRKKATFYDKEYDVYFESYVANVLRGKGYCPQRNAEQTKKSWTLTAEEIQQRVKEIYNGRIELVESSYINTNTLAKWHIDKKKTVTVLPSSMLRGMYFERKELERWRARVWVRDNFTCQKCGDENSDIAAHHILPSFKFPEYRFDLDNGICLCRDCHNLYHSTCKNEETKENFKTFMDHPNPKELKWIAPKPDAKEITVISPTGEIFSAYSFARLAELTGCEIGNLQQTFNGKRHHTQGFYFPNPSDRAKEYINRYMRKNGYPEI